MYCEKVFKNRGFVQVTDRDSDLLAHPGQSHLKVRLKPGDTAALESLAKRC